jgi:hypothetical protein
VACARPLDAAADRLGQAIERHIDTGVAVLVQLFDVEWRLSRQVDHEPTEFVAAASWSVDIAEANVDGSDPVTEAAQVLVDLAGDVLGQAVRDGEPFETNVDLHVALLRASWNGTLWRYDGRCAAVVSDEIFTE